MTVCTVSVMFGNIAEAMHVGHLVVAERLAACVNVHGACTSIYWWDGRVQQSDEVPASFKTTTARVDALIARIAELHAYDVPAITVAPVDRLLASFGDWVEAEVR